MGNKNSVIFNRYFDLGLIGLALITITWLHFRWMSAPMVYHALLQFLYYLPVIYSAVRYGIRGGVLAALVASSAFAIHMVDACSVDELVYQLIQVVLINFIGWVAGVISQSEKKLTQRYLDLTVQQESLIQELEQSNAAVAQMNKELEHEIAERQTLEEWVRRNERLNAMGRLAAGVAHEMRNPIGIIRTTMQILEEEQKDNQSVRDCAGVIIEECDRMNSVVGEFLEFARPAEPKFEKVDLAGLIEEVMLFTSKYVSRQGIQVITDIPDDLLPVWADGGQIKQVLVNLIINAVDAMPNGGLLKIKGSQKGSIQEISVKDSGEGIPESLLSQIFEPFFSTKPKGTGLGLPIIYRILENHHGKIEVYSKPGEGTEFVITLNAKDFKNDYKF